MSRALFLYRKCSFKAREMLLRAATRARFPLESDPSRLLVEHLSSAQRAALAAEAASDSTSGGPPRVLIVIPFRDRWDLTGRCLASLEEQTAFLAAREKGSLRVALVDNGSVRPETRAGVDLYSRKPGFSPLRIDAPFNFSRLNNLALEDAHAAGFSSDLCLFLNNDIEFTEPGQLASLVEFAWRTPGAGAVGCTLLYPDARVQHLYLAPGVKIVGGHPCRGTPWHRIHAWRLRPWPVPAVTGAALCVRTEDFRAAGGFDETLATAYQDLDLCLKLQRAGRVNWTLPEVSLVHHETATRAAVHHTAEVLTMYERWGKFLTENPYSSTSLSRWSETPALSLGEGPYPWRDYLCEAR